jgi:hypothetical protein
MTDDEAANYFAHHNDEPVKVTGGDYVYHGWLVAFFQKRKRKGGWRCVVEDGNGRLFIHNPSQLSKWPFTMPDMP